MKFTTNFLSMIAATATAGAPEEYILTNISSWMPAELAALPHFDHYIPLQPDGATAGTHRFMRLAVRTP